jgi:hypothetical protein
MTTPSITTLILGDTTPVEFGPILDLVKQHVPAGSRRSAADFKSSGQLIGSGWFPDLVIALQTWPDQFSATEVEELISLCPLARILCCFGPWCDSDGRTRSIWPLGVRVPFAGFAPRFEHEMALLANNRDAGRPLPLTASRTEIFEFDFGRSQWRDSSNQPFSVVSPDGRFREMLVSALKTAGLRLHEFDKLDETPATIIFDADPWDSDRKAALATILAAHPRARLVACLGFPRPHIETKLRDAGANAVWFKLSPLTELIDCLAASREPAPLA